MLRRIVNERGCEMGWHEDSVKKWQDAVSILSPPNRDFKFEGDYLEAVGNEGPWRVKVLGKCGYCEHYNMHCKQCPLNRFVCTSYQNLDMPTWRFVKALHEGRWDTARANAQIVLDGIIGVRKGITYTPKKGLPMGSKK